MAVAIGNKSFVQFGVEGTYGTNAPCTGYRMEIISANIDPVIGTIPSASLYQGASRRAINQGGLFYQGKIVMEGRYYGIGRLLRAAFGAVATSGSFTHTYTEATAPPSLTIELGEGDIPAGTVKRALGCVVTDFSVSCTAGQNEDAQATVEIGIAAKTVSLGATPVALSYPSAAQSNPWLFHQSTSVTNDGSGDTQANQRVHEVKLTVTNPYALDRFYFGSLTPDSPIRNDFLEAKWEFTSDYQTTAALTAVPAWTVTQPALKFQSGSDTVEFRSVEAHITNYGNPVEGYGPMVMKITHEAYRSGTNSDSSAVKCILVNTDSAATNGDTSP